VIELATRKPQSHVFETLGVVVHGQGFATRAVTDDLAQRYPDPTRDLLNIGLLHTCVNGRPGHDPYAPCALETLVNKGYDYWALGHVHQREILSRNPWIVFPGNLQGRHARETGAKGATLVTVNDGRIVDVAHRALDVVRWLTCEVDVSGAAIPEDMLELVRERFDTLIGECEGRTLALRLILSGMTPAHDAFEVERERWEQELRGAANDTAGDGLWLEQVRSTTVPHLDHAALAARDDAIGHIVRAARAMAGDPNAADALADELTEVRLRLPPDARDEVGPDAIREALADVERTLLPRLLAERRHS
jgi:DNA repair exonuclease SbcCD nuclease subunit